MDFSLSSKKGSSPVDPNSYVYADTLKFMMGMCLIIYHLQGDAPRSYKLVSL